MYQKILILSLFAAWFLTACRTNPVPARTPSLQNPPASDDTAAQMTSMFGEACITHQTFEVRLSEYDDPIYFVPFSPSGHEDFHIQLLQNNQVLTELPSYVPEELAGEPFTSLDAVSFYDVNYDGFTDIVLIETYGTSSFAAVYYGFDRHGEDYEKSFSPQAQLSQAITKTTSPLSISQIRKVLSDGKKNGEFADYQEAYRALGRLHQMSDSGDISYSLINIDHDQIPELAAGVNGYYISLYTYWDGRIYPLMDRWAYGAMGNSGYEYSPGKNNIRNYNTDYAGAILHTTYMSINQEHSLEVTARIDTYNFDDVNQNGVPDEDELGSLGLYGASYVNGEQVTPEECMAFDAGEYEMIMGTMDFEGLCQSFQ